MQFLLSFLLLLCLFSPVLGLSPLPIVSPESVGMNSTALAAIHPLVMNAISTRLTPGAALAVIRHGSYVLVSGYGTLDYNSSIPVDQHTYYDIASLSKVSATTSFAMNLYQLGKLNLSAPIMHYLPDWRGDAEKESVTVHQLLTHTSGLQPDVNYYLDGITGRKAYLAGIYQLPLQYPPGTRFMYSDLNFILLQAIIEGQMGETLDNLLYGWMLQSMQLDHFVYNPLMPRGYRLPESDDCRLGLKVNPSSPLLNQTVWEEVDNIWRHLHIHGIVHDENACAIGGVSGHAGVFASLNNLARLTNMLLHNGSFVDENGKIQQLIAPEVVALFTRRQDPRWSRALGWDTPAEGCVCGDYITNDSFGHTGFTGTMIWADKQLDLGIVLLTNRVDPTRENGTGERIMQFRREVSDAIALAITDMPVSQQPRTPS